MSKVREDVIFYRFKAENIVSIFEEKKSSNYKVVETTLN
jgi:hypothetical protein